MSSLRNGVSPHELDIQSVLSFVGGRMFECGMYEEAVFGSEDRPSDNASPWTCIAILCGIVFSIFNLFLSEVPKN